MKKFTLLLLAVFLIQLNLFSQSCLSEGITFHFQTEIDSFQINNPNCTEIEGNVDISWNNIHNLNGLNGLTKIGGYLWISNCDSLSNITGLHNINSIGGALHIAGIDRLKNLTGLEGLITINDLFEVVFCDSIMNLSGINSLSYVGGDIQIHSNPLLSDLSGIENLSTTNGGLFIGFNDNLISLNGFQNLTSIGGNIAIHENNFLESLSGIDNINSGSISNLEISANSSLATCEVKSICEYLIAPSGTTVISDNGTGCNNKLEVETACEIVTTSELKLNDLFEISPNPAKNNLTIMNRKDIEIKQIIIYNQLGERKYFSKTNEKCIDISMLDKGIYILEIQIENNSYRKKLIVN
jgi:hypothetical protein